MTLEELLELHIRVVRQVAANVEPHGDVAPLLGAWRDGTMIAHALVELPADRAQRHAMQEPAMRFLQERHADAYTMVLTAWQSGKMLSQEEYKEWIASGKSVSERKDRIEVVCCIAGDRERTLHTDLEIVRSPAGLISHLKRREYGERVAVIGLFHDLLLQAAARQRLN